MAEPWQKITILELAIWTALAAFVFSTPSWMGFSSIIPVFYLTLLAVTWRLSHFMSVFFAYLLGGSLALIATVFLISYGGM